nr:MAG TPA: hypothetical protein [Caudoviricetes sp.]
MDKLVGCGIDGMRKRLSEPQRAIAGMEDGMDQPVEEVDRISWEADMMLAEEHFDAMDEDAYRDEDYAEEGTGDEGWETE